jgi:hypothetical protein
VVLIFFLCALATDVYEHFGHASANNVFMVAASELGACFEASVGGLLALEILACLLGILLINRRQGMRATA